MCNTWKHPTDPLKEIGIEIYEKLPSMKTINVTGGEPFLRRDLTEIVGVLRRKAKRLVISSNGYFTERRFKLSIKYSDMVFESASKAGPREGLNSVGRSPIPPYGSWSTSSWAGNSASSRG